MIYIIQLRVFDMGLSLKIDLNRLVEGLTEGAKGKQKCPDCNRTITSASDVVKAARKGLSKKDWAQSCDTIEESTKNSDHNYEYQCKGCGTGIDITWTGAVR